MWCVIYIYNLLSKNKVLKFFRIVSTEVQSSFQVATKIQQHERQKKKINEKVEHILRGRDYNFDEVLGEGAFSTVVQVESITDKQKYAIKITLSI